MTSSTHSPIISIDGLTKKYAQRTALDHFDLEIYHGELFCLLGPNGGGKSTLFRILSTFMLPDEGKVTLCGIKLDQNPSGIRSKIATLFQSPSLDLKLTVHENLCCGGALYGLKGKLLEERIDKALQSLNLQSRIHDLVETLSGGLQRRVEIAKCLLSKPEILLLDEPSSGLDPSARLELWQTLNQLRQQEKITIFWTSHIMEEAARADRVAILSEGKLIAIGQPQELIQELHSGVITLQVKESEHDFLQKLQEQYAIKAILFHQEIRIEHPNPYDFVRNLSADFQQKITGLQITEPTLEDVFITRTGKRFEEENLDKTNLS